RPAAAAGGAGGPAAGPTPPARTRPRRVQDTPSADQGAGAAKPSSTSSGWAPSSGNQARSGPAGASPPTRRTAPSTPAAWSSRSAASTRRARRTVTGERDTGPPGTDRRSPVISAGAARPGDHEPVAGDATER